LIVVALLATVVSLAVPSLRKLSEKGQLQDAARQLRARLLAARLDAIESATCTYFYYEQGSGTYAVTRAAEFTADSDSLAAALPADAPDEPLAASQASEESPETLASGIRFTAGLADNDTPATASMLSGVESAGWSEPVVFYPNGRSLNARIRLATDRYWIDMTVRGLTGTVQLSPVQKFSEPDETTSGRLPEAGL